MPLTRDQHPTTLNLKLCRKVQASRLQSLNDLIANRSRIRLYATIKKQNGSEAIDEYFFTHQPVNLRDEDDDAAFAASFFGQTNQAEDMSKDSYSIVVAKKFISNAQAEPVTYQPLQPELPKIRSPQIPKLLSPSQKQPSQQQIPDIKTFLAMTYENYKKNFDVSLQTPKQTEAPIHSNLQALRKSRRGEAAFKSITRNYLDKYHCSSNKSSFIEGSSCNETIEELVVAPVRALGNRQNSFSGLFSLRSNSKSNKLTATTIASIGGFSRGDDYFYR
jgi:hypothetical protein